jgi:hypothetical protein
LRKVASSAQGCLQRTGVLQATWDKCGSHTNLPSAHFRLRRPRAVPAPSPRSAAQRATGSVQWAGVLGAPEPHASWNACAALGGMLAYAVAWPHGSAQQQG